jgi:hypothetical protein
MRFSKSFKRERFIISIFVIGGLALISYWSALASSEGANNSLIKFMAYSFYVFGFPSHILLSIFFDDNGGWALFFFGLFINAVFYAFFLEVVISFFKKANRVKKYHDLKEQFTLKSISDFVTKKRRPTSACRKRLTCMAYHHL